MKIQIRGAREHNLKGIDVDIGDGLTVVTGVSGSGKTSLVFDTLYHEARRRFLEVYSSGSATARLAPADVDSLTGIGPAVAVEQNLLNRNPASTLATAAGLHPFLRLLYARFGEQICQACGNPLVVYSEDEIIERLAEISRSEVVNVSAILVQDMIGSQRTLLRELESMFTADNLRIDGQVWSGGELIAENRHRIELRLAQISGGESVADLRRLIEQAREMGSQAIHAQTGAKSQIFSWVRVCADCGTWAGDAPQAVQFHQPCPACGGKGCTECKGSGLHPLAAAVRWNRYSFVELLTLSVDEAKEMFAHLAGVRSDARLLDEIQRRLEALQKVGLGYIALERSATSLSRGESQRVRLALTLISRLEDMLHVLDEPTIGLHTMDVERLTRVFRQLAGPVVYVEHDRTSAYEADQVLDIGPGAGHEGGRVIFQGTPEDLWKADTPSGRYFSQRLRVERLDLRGPAQSFLTVLGANLRNLQNIDVKFPLGRLTVISGVSGSGKSTLIEDVLTASLDARKAVGCERIEGEWLKVIAVDQSPIGRNPRSNPATYTGLAELIRDLFARASKLPASMFSFNRPDGACPTCQGLGAVEVKMRYLPSTWVMCEDCGGQRFSEKVLEAKIDFKGNLLSIADFLNLTVADVLALWKDETRLPEGDVKAGMRILEALVDIGLGYLTLGQPSTTLSGGEAQRTKLAKYLSQRSLAQQMLVLDEPSTGLHPQDLAGLQVVLLRLVRAGATIVVVEHNLDLIRGADWVVDLGPGAGPLGGRLLYAGTPEGLEKCAESLTGQALRAERDSRPPTLVREKKTERQPVIKIRGARMHNLKNIDVDFLKGKFTVVTGVSGSGKSTLVSDILEAEARRCFLETLSMYERQGTHEGPEAEVASISGLGVALTATPERLAYSRRSTVGTLTEIAHLLAVLFAASTERICLKCGAAMERSRLSWQCPACGTRAEAAKPQHFSSRTYSSACLKCNGVGSLQVPRPDKLITAPEKPLLAGAMYSPGFFPNGYLGKPFNGGYYRLQALARHYGFDPFETPWKMMTPEAQNAFLFGAPGPFEVTSESRNGQINTYQSAYPGFYGFVRDWDVGNMYTENQACLDCGGARLRPEYLAVKINGKNIFELSLMPMRQLIHHFDGVALWGGEAGLVRSSLKTLLSRLQFIDAVGIGYLRLDRPAGTLSAGEVQRIRLASLLGSGLTSLTVLVDEPTRGLHPAEVEALSAALVQLKNEGNTVIVVEHDPVLMRTADILIDMGPAAGDAGGEVVEQGPPDVLIREGKGLTADWLRGGKSVLMRLPRRPAQGWMTLRGARENNLRGDVLEIPLGVLTGICGVSGSGKSTLILDTLGRILAPKKHTTSVAYEPFDPGVYDALEGAPKRVVLMDQSKNGIGSPVNALELVRPLREIYAESEDAEALGLTEEQLSTRCASCGGSGVLRIDMAFLPDLFEPCETCQGTGFLPEAWEVKLHGLALPDVYRCTIERVFELFGEDERISRPLKAARDVGLSYLVLNQPGSSLSGGEAQRLKVAQELSKRIPSGTLYIFDEPTVGQHLEDVNRLVGVLQRLVDEGGSVVVVEHHIHLLAACDWLVELGPGGGPEGGRIIATGTPETLAAGTTPTAAYIKEVLEVKP